jgi:hypothetical protein
MITDHAPAISTVDNGMLSTVEDRKKGAANVFGVMDIPAAKTDLRPRKLALEDTFATAKAAAVEARDDQSDDRADKDRLADETEAAAERTLSHFYDGYFTIQDVLRADKAAATSTEQRRAAIDALAVFYAEFGRHGIKRPDGR